MTTRLLIIHDTYSEAEAIYLDGKLRAEFDGPLTSADLIECYEAFARDVPVIIERIEVDIYDREEDEIVWPEDWSAGWNEAVFSVEFSGAGKQTEVRGSQLIRHLREHHPRGQYMLYIMFTDGPEFFYYWPHRQEFESMIDTEKFPRSKAAADYFNKLLAEVPA